MEISYWQSRWQKNHTGWHMDQVYPLLTKLWPHLPFKSNTQVLVPLCGKTLDMKWLAEKGCHVLGVDASPKALREFRALCPDEFLEDTSHSFSVYRSPNIELWEGDFLKLPKSKVPGPDLIYDKAAMVALPPEIRKTYTQKILELCEHNTQILLQTFEYNQEEMNGPPFSVDENEICRHFENQFSIQLMHKQSKFNELSKFQQRGLSSYFDEKVFWLTPL